MQIQSSENGHARTPLRLEGAAIGLLLGTLSFLLCSSPAVGDDVLSTVSIDPWRGDRSENVLILEVPAAGERPLTIEVDTRVGLFVASVPAGSAAGTLVLTAADLRIDPWELPLTGRCVTWRVLDPRAEVIAEGAQQVRLRTARESLDLLAGAVENSADDLERAQALLSAARFALDLGQPALADPWVVDLRTLLARLAAKDPGSTRFLSLAGTILEARIQRSFADTDSRHRRAAEDRLGRIDEAVSAYPDLAARRAILLCEADLARLPGADNPRERQKILDIAREHARAARQGGGEGTAERAELLWVQVALGRGWRTEAQETLDRCSDLDPRLAVGVAHLRARLAALDGKASEVARELDRAIETVEHLRDRLGDPEFDGGFLRLHLAPYRDRIRLAAVRGDGRGALLAIERARPRSRSDLAGLDLDRAVLQLGEGTTLLALAEVGDALISVRADSDGIVAHLEPVAPGATEERVAALLRSRGEDRAAATWLAAGLLAPHRDSLAPQVLLAPLGVLRPIPYDLLPLGGRYLCEGHIVSTIPDLGALLRPAPAPVAPWLALVDPSTDYDGDGVPDRPGLASTRDEIAPWAELGDDVILRGGMEAQESSLRADGVRAGVIHLGCHGEHERHRPMHSRLLLAPGEGEDGRVSASELAGLDLSGTALVCLSGCETGLSRALGGDDLAGFPRAVLESGAGALLGSLWPVDDTTAGAFFRSFHSRFRETRDARDALRRARLDSLADPDRRSPKQWGSWILLENSWKTVDNEP